MSENDRSERSRVYTPEYWGNHHVDDACAWKTPASPEYPGTELDHAARFISKTLRTYFRVADKSPRVISLFDADMYPEGTIIRYESDLLLINSTLEVPDPRPDGLLYQRTSDWAVVFGIDTKEGRKRMLGHVPDIPTLREETDFILSTLAFSSELTIQVGDISHKRIRGITENITKITKLELHQMGKREDQKKRFSLPRWGRIFQKRPLPENG